MTNTPSWTVLDCLNALYRFKVRALAAFVVVMASGVAWVSSLPHMYESDAMLFVRLGWENASLDPTGKQGDASANSSSELEISTMIEHLRSRSVMEKAMNTISPASPGESREQRERAFNNFRSRITVTSPKASMIIKIASKAENPEEAQKVVSTLTDLYIDEHLHISRPAGSYEFLSQRSNRLREEFEAMQAELRDAKNRIGLSSLDGRRAALESQIGQLEIKVQEVTTSLVASEAKMKNLEATINSLPDPLLKQMVGGTPNDGFADMQAKSFELQVRREETGSKFTAEHPLYIAVNRQAEEIKALLKREAPDRLEIIRSISAAERASQAAMNAQLESLQNQMIELKESLTRLNNNETNVAILSLKLANAQNRYLAYDAKAEDARIEEDLLKEKLSNVRVIQSASFATLPVGPQKSSLMLLVLVCAFVVGCAIAMASEFFDRAVNQRIPNLRNRPIIQRQPLSHFSGIDGSSLQKSVSI